MSHIPITDEFFHEPPSSLRGAPYSTFFRARVFPADRILSEKSYQQYRDILNGKAKLEMTFADEIAQTLKEWAIQAGATHFTHWFQPLNGKSAEKHEAFLSWGQKGSAIENFRGKDLLHGESDASSFPSGGLRSTHQARGYTVWDPSANPFLWESGGSFTLCIPALFFSWKGEALDHKIPLLRSHEKINKMGLRLLKLCGIPAHHVFSNLGLEQEYFVMDRKWFNARPDLILTGRTVYGKRSPKGQELEDHYFGVVKNRILSYMRDFEEAAVQLGIPVRTRHNEVAPSQYEIAPLFENSSLAVDHNVMLMELMKEKAVKHSLACLLHEKPFAHINGSGKHSNWSLGTDTGLNLLDPKQDSMVFLILLTAILRAVHQHSGLLRATVASAGNDYRLGEAEAPPTILSVSLGDSLEKIVERLIQKKIPDKEVLRSIDLGLAHVPECVVDSSDRNRTSFFAFTGNKFEFRAVGAAAHPALPITTINAIVADSLELILDEIGDRVADALPVLRKHLKAASPVLFGGNGYSLEWEKEAKKRGLPNIRKSFHAFGQFLDKKSLRAFEGILSQKELEARSEILIEQYAKTMNIELNLIIDLFRTAILPAALQDQKRRAEALKALPAKQDAQRKALHTLATSISDAIVSVDQLETAQNQIEGLGWEAKGRAFADLIGPKMEKARVKVDRLEALVDNRLWPFPKYREMLFSP